MRSELSFVAPLPVGEVVELWGNVPELALFGQRRDDVAVQSRDEVAAGVLLAASAVLLLRSAARSSVLARDLAVQRDRGRLARMRGDWDAAGMYAQRCADLADLILSGDGYFQGAPS